MATLFDVLNDKSKSDDLKITIEGVESTLGELRKSAMMESDYRRKTMALANERRDFDQTRSEWEYARMDAETKLTELAKQIATANPGATREEIEDEMDASPKARKLQARIDALEQKLDAAQKGQQQIGQAVANANLAMYVDQHRRALAYLKQQDKDLDESALVEHAKAKGIPNLVEAYKSYNYDKAIETAKKTAREEGLKEGLEKAKRDSAAVRIPERRVITPAPDRPKNMNEAIDSAMADSDVIKAMQDDGLI